MTPHLAAKPAPLGLGRWRRLPGVLVAAGGLLALAGAAVNLGEFAHAWLLGFLFWLSIALGALFLVMMHHLFDAGWSVPLRRFCEHLASLLFPWMLLLWIPVGLLAPQLYPWMRANRQADAALEAPCPLFTVPMFYAVAALCFGAWWLVSYRLSYWSLKQDQTGAARCTHRMRFYSCVGIFIFAISLTLAAVVWITAMQPRWFSTIYGLCYFTGSVWTALATVYLITALVRRQRVFTGVLHDGQLRLLGALLLAFTLLYGYVHFSQYFVIWNANLPEETFWYVTREQGGWFGVGMVIILGHFVLPFLILLRRDLKSALPILLPLCGWAWLMHLVDLGFNIYPATHPTGPPLRWLWVTLGSWAFMGGLLAMVFLRKLAAAPPYPVKDPRLIEALDLRFPVAGQSLSGTSDPADGLGDGRRPAPATAP